VHYRLASKNRISVHCSGAGNIRSKHAALIGTVDPLTKTHQSDWHMRFFPLASLIDPDRSVLISIYVY
jgi:hypothetical protein